MLDRLYTHLARARRRYYQRRPDRRRRLARPVVSVGNLTVGGSGKTPAVAEIARLLLHAGERPSILSRGYRRLKPSDGVVVVSDGQTVRAGVEESGDEPLMLARAVDGAVVLVGSSRYVAGRLAESRFGCTVHLLDDGFQHLALMRDVDLLVTPPEDFGDVATLPFGRFREPLDAAASADALLVPDADEAAALAVSTRLHVTPAFTFQRSIGGPGGTDPVFAFAGIAKPAAFFDALHRAGWQVAGQRAFADHHHYRAVELDELRRSASQAGARLLVTTEKDYVRLEPLQAPPGALIAVPLRTSIEPAFGEWLLARLRAVRRP